MYDHHAILRRSGWISEGHDCVVSLVADSISIVLGSTIDRPSTLFSVIDSTFTP